MDHLPDARDDAAAAGRRQRSGPGEFEEQDLGSPRPVLFRPARKVAAREEAGLVVVRAEVGGTGVRDVDGDHRDARLMVGGGNRRRDRFVGLKLDDEIHAFPDEQLRVLQRDLRLITVVRDDQFDLGPFRGANEAVMNLAREGAVLTLRRIADAVFLPAPDLGGQPVAVVLHLLDEPAVPEGVEQAEAHAFAEAGPRHDVAEAERLPRVLKRPENL